MTPPETTLELVDHLPGADLGIGFEEGEELRSEIPATFRPSGSTSEPGTAGLSATGRSTDPEPRFALALAGPA